MELKGEEEEDLMMSMVLCLLVNFVTLPIALSGWYICAIEVFAMGTNPTPYRCSATL